jgi:hypothetical protein
VLAGVRTLKETIETNKEVSRLHQQEAGVRIQQCKTETSIESTYIRRCHFSGQNIFTAFQHGMIRELDIVDHCYHDLKAYPILQGSREL